MDMTDDVDLELADSEAYTIFQPRHDVAYVCDNAKRLDGETQQKANKELWELCNASPYVYRCLGDGTMTKQQYLPHCSSLCKCHDMNPRPKILNWAIGQVPKGGS